MKSRTYLNLAWLTSGIAALAVVFLQSPAVVTVSCGLLVLASVVVNTVNERRRRRPVDWPFTDHRDQTKRWLGPDFPIRCRICDEVRRYDEIDVVVRPLPDLPGSTVNIQHCNDRPDCIEGAKTHNPFPTVYPNLLDGKE